MSPTQQQYCLDANVLIQAWQKYYSMSLCPSYWDFLNDLGAAQRIFLPHHVREEIIRTEDDLAEWVKKSKIPIYPVDGPVTLELRKMYAANPAHQTLVARGRSLADPWVIATAMSTKACVVTKEEMITAQNSTKVKIPNVCKNMNVRCIDDFKFLQEVAASFTCKR
jgi:predicted nucleic acid-binding protein